MPFEAHLKRARVSPRVTYAMSNVIEKTALLENHRGGDIPVRTASDNVRAITFYLPQFHPIPENDEWWGKGFTEWTNVSKAKPLFPGHDQPHLPADLGYYDLRAPETRAAQAELAQQYGVGAFCYWHYWFQGRRLLERPFQEVLDSGEPDFPFCLAWANETWSRRWNGSEQDVLVQQTYSPDDDRDHIRWLLRAFADPRYVRVNGKPLFIVYRVTQLLPDPQRTTDAWRDEAHKAGLGDLHLCYVDMGLHSMITPKMLGFDAALEFAPDGGLLPKYQPPGLPERVLNKLKIRKALAWEHHLFDYAEAMRLHLNRPEVSYIRYPCVFPAWDNSARKAKWSRIATDSSPELYEAWLTEAVKTKVPRQPGHQICFINAWNEWAEGNHLEPCHRWGRAYLEATRRVITGAPSRVSPAVAGRVGE